MLTRNGQLNGDGSFNWKDAFVDASITAGVALSSSLITALGDGTITLYECYLSCALTFAAFIGFLAAKRNLTAKIVTTTTTTTD